MELVTRCWIVGRGRAATCAGVPRRSKPQVGPQRRLATLRGPLPLSTADASELVDAYRRGAAEKDLARRYGLHRHTVSRHLQRVGVAKRPAAKMSPALVEPAKRLYEAGWSTSKIGGEIGFSASAVGKELKRAGVRLRPPAAPNRRY